MLSARKIFAGVTITDFGLYWFCSEKLPFSNFCWEPPDPDLMGLRGEE